ncbi:MAG: metallophosphoesterase [Pseudomonadota bacterium]|nr:metallophosphoesterase [Pseudomonadota bacterium]
MRAERLSWLHFGDLHITDTGADNHRDFRALIAQANEHLAGAVDFAVLPGDNADDGTEAQFRLVRHALDALRIPIHILPGDHDFKSRGLNGFHAVLGADPLPKAVTVAGTRCLFLDAVSAGTGGPDFRLGRRQIDWLTRELAGADSAGRRSVVFMHVYPADLGNEAAEVSALLRRHRVLAVDMGHTHYNELANDGTTVFAATRSTGQIEEGTVGFSLAAIDDGVFSWRFKPLATSWPFVLITAPADRRLVTDPAQVVRGAFEVRAHAWSGRGIARAACRVDDGTWREMAPEAGTPVWRVTCPARETPFRLTVRIEDNAGASDSDMIEVAAGAFGATTHHADGSDKDALGAWPEKGIPGGQLGPNRNGRKW